MLVPSGFAAGETVMLGTSTIPRLRSSIGQLEAIVVGRGRRGSASLRHVRGGNAGGSSSSLDPLDVSL